MDAIQQQFKQLQAAWTTAYKSLAPNPAVYQPHLPGANLEQLNEAVSALRHWLDRSRAPKGFAPTFHLARALASTSLTAASTAAQALARGELGHFPAFVLGINQTIVALHSMVLFSQKDSTEGLNNSLTGSLSEALALLETAQSELASKMEELNAASDALLSSEKIAKQIETWSKAAEENASSVAQHKDDSATAAEEAAASATELKELKAAAGQTLKQADAAATALAERQATLDALTVKTQEQQALITALLPKGASAGLASAFASRVKELESTKWLWAAVFGGSMICLFALAFYVLHVAEASAEPLWQLLLQRVPFAVPMVWMGWFAAVQYGNTLRVQEDYAFKEATSKAFAGYRDHMEHLATVNLEAGNSAMTLLAERTINILALEPLRIFQGIDQDSTPSGSLLGSLRARHPSKDETE